MTSLIKGHSVLKSSPVITSGRTIYRYRLTIENDTLNVHVESRQSNGMMSSEQFLYSGPDLLKAMDIYLKYSEEK